MKAAAYALVMTVAQVAAAPVTAARPQPLHLGGIDLPVVPALIGVFVCGLVRVIIIIGSPTKLTAGQAKRAVLVYNVAVTLLCMAGAAAWIAERQIWGPGTSFAIGLTCGAIGEGFIKIGRSKLAGRAKDALDLFLNGDRKTDT